MTFNYYGRIVEVNMSNHPRYGFWDEESRMETQEVMNSEEKYIDTTELDFCKMLDYDEAKKLMRKVKHCKINYSR